MNRFRPVTHPSQDRKYIITWLAAIEQLVPSISRIINRYRNKTSPPWSGPLPCAAVHCSHKALFIGETYRTVGKRGDSIRPSAMPFWGHDGFAVQCGSDGCRRFRREDRHAC